MKKVTILDELIEIIKKKKNNPTKNSYTTFLFQQGKEKIANKFGEEAFELTTACLTQDKKEIIHETADLIYHLFVLLEESKVSPEEVWDLLQQRMKEEKKDK